MKISDSVNCKSLKIQKILKTNKQANEEVTIEILKCHKNEIDGKIKTNDKLI